MRKLDGVKVVVVGMGLSGVAAVRLLRRKGAIVRAVDEKTMGEIEGVTIQPQTEAAFRDAELVVLSPGVPADLGLLASARARGVPVIGELELAAPYLEGRNIAITGTKRQDYDHRTHRAPSARERDRIARWAAISAPRPPEMVGNFAARSVERAGAFELSIGNHPDLSRAHRSLPQPDAKPFGPAPFV